MATNRDLLTAEEIAAHLEVERSTVWKWGNDGRIPTVRLTSRVIRYRLADVLAALEPGNRPEASVNP